MNFASLCLGVFLYSLSAVIDCAIVEGNKTPGELQRQSTRIGRKLLATADYPTFPVVPPTAFRCSPGNPGYFADTEGLCQVFHLCQIDGRHDSFLCPNGTLFNQKHFVCDWWYNVDCAAAPSLYILNEVFRQQHLSGREQANVHPHSVNKFVNPEASIQSYDVPSTISAARPETIASTNRNQQAVTATIARGQSPTVSHQQYSTQFVNVGDKYGSKIPGVNRMGGLDTVLLQNQIINRERDDSTAPVTTQQVLLEFTEATPTTTEPFNEDQFGSHLKLQLGVEEELTVIPVTTNAAFFSENHNVGATFLTLPNKDSLVKPGEKLAESSDAAVESVHSILTENDQLNEELSTFQPNLADVQTSAVVVTLNSLSERDFDDEYRTTTPLTSPTTDLAAHFLQVPTNATEESTEDIASINKVNTANAAVDFSESNFVTGLEATTFPTISFNTDDVQTLPEVKTTTAPALIEPPIVEGLNFNVIADSQPLDLETEITDDSVTTVVPDVNIQQVFASAFAESSSGDDNINASFSNSSSHFALTTETISESTTSPNTEATPELSTTVASIKGDGAVASSLIANSDGKKTLYEKLKPVIVGDDRPNIPAIYGRKIPRIGNKLAKFIVN
uniref:Chitin-binding type-2 domain-containing protein n=1 Tax=Daphnia magna TaxID=35525 RepID=A0A0P6DHC3_9CRUS